MDRWLDNLQKSPAPARPRPEPTRPNVPLQFLDLCELDAGAVGGEDDFGKALNAPEDPLGAFLERTHLALLVKSPGVADESWDAPLAKRVSPAPNVKKITRFDIVTIDGERWSRAFNDAGDLVDQRVLLPEIA